jgi:hypothetical protein
VFGPISDIIKWRSSSTWGCVSCDLFFAAGSPATNFAAGSPATLNLQGLPQSTLPTFAFAKCFFLCAASSRLPECSRMLCSAKWVTVLSQPYPCVLYCAQLVKNAYLFVFIYCTIVSLSLLSCLICRSLFYPYFLFYLSII